MWFTSSRCMLDPDVLVHKSQSIHFQGFYKPVKKMHYLTNLLLKIRLYKFTFDYVKTKLIETKKTHSFLSFYIFTMIMTLMLFTRILSVWSKYYKIVCW